MNKIALGLLSTLVLLAAGCSSEVVKREPIHVPPPVPGKAAVTTCSASTCDITEVVMSVVGTTCKARFNFQRVLVDTGTTATFALVDYQRLYLFRFTSNPIGIDIDYRGDPPAFGVGFGDAEQRTVRVKSLAIDPHQRGRLYPFAIHTEWSSDGGRTWASCVELDPLIANN